MSRQDKMKELVGKYIDARGSIYYSIQKEGLSSRSQVLNQEKKDLGQKILDLANDREYDTFAKGFQEAIGMVGSKISGCSTQEMGIYIKNANSDTYFNCLAFQKNALIELVDDVIRPIFTIIDAEDSIITCNGVYHDGVCHPE